MHAGDVRHTLLSDTPASWRDRKIALAVVAVVSTFPFAIAFPYAGVPLAPPAFVASH
jgi:hypothetical protein